jgi:hypothetical protein
VVVVGTPVTEQTDAPRRQGPCDLLDIFPGTRDSASQNFERRVGIRPLARGITRTPRVFKYVTANIFASGGYLRIDAEIRGKWVFAPRK